MPVLFLIQTLFYFLSGEVGPPQLSGSAHVASRGLLGLLRGTRVLFCSVYGNPRRQSKKQKLFERLSRQYHAVNLRETDGARADITTLERGEPLFSHSGGCGQRRSRL